MCFILMKYKDKIGNRISEANPFYVLIILKKANEDIKDKL